MPRPKHLPDFTSPPLDEVVFGVQFAVVPGYMSIHAGRVWDIFRQEFPHVQEQPPLAQAFETFGLPQTNTFSFGFTSSLPHNRFWFLSEKGEELIQFQSDRLLHNWRKVGDRTNEYPRFEAIIKKFQGELSALEDYFETFKSGKLRITQCEISYVNKIPAASDLNPQSWLRFVGADSIAMDDFTMVFRRVIQGKDRKPLGRLICEAVTDLNTKGQPLISLTLTVRGAPATPDIAGTLDFLKQGRETIVTTFAEITTDSAHKAWGRL